MIGRAKRRQVRPLHSRRHHTLSGWVFLRVDQASYGPVTVWRLRAAGSSLLCAQNIIEGF